jgi:hypothetical protein
MRNGTDILLICCCATAAFARQEITRDFQKTAALPAGRTLRVVHSLGNVTVRTQAKGELSVQAAMRCSGDRDDVRSFCDKIQIRVDESPTGIVVRTEYPHTGGFTGFRNLSYSVSLDITMPETAPLELRNRFGSVTVQNLHAAAKIDNDNGRVSFLNGRGRQRIDNSFGDVEVRTNEGDVTVVNTNGMVTASDITGTLEVGNGFGDVRVTNIGRGLIIHSGNGKVEAGHVTGILQISDSFGDVRVWDAKAGVTVQNQNGKVEAMEIAGAADLRTSFATVNFSRMGKDVTVRGQNASVIGAMVAGSVNAETSFGVVDLREVKGGARVIAGNTEVRLSDIAGEVYAKTSFAGVTVQGAGGPITVESANGSVTAAPKPGPCKPVSLATSFGPIRVTIPGNAGYNVTGKTSFGRIHSEAEMTVSGNISTDEITGRIGSGGCELRLMNQNGNIDILKSR